MSKRPQIISSNLTPEDRMFSLRLGRQKIADGLSFLRHSIADDSINWTCDFEEFFLKVENNSRITCSEVAKYLEDRFNNERSRS